jgi:hypothetical protein
LRDGARNLIVTVQAGARPDPGLLTCHARHESHPPVFDVVEVREVG